MDERRPSDPGKTETGDGPSRETLDGPDTFCLLRALDLGDTEMAVTFSPAPAERE